MGSVRKGNLCADSTLTYTIPDVCLMKAEVYLHCSCVLCGCYCIYSYFVATVNSRTALSFVRFDSSLTLAYGVPHYVCTERSLNQACKQQAQGTEMKIVISHHCRIHRKKRWGKNICSVSTNECPAWGLRMNVYALLRWKCSENKCPECKLNQVHYIFFSPHCV